MSHQFLLSLAFCVLSFITTDAFLFSSKMDCSVSEWSAWSKPYGFGQIARGRDVLRYPLNNGTECPALEERQFTGARPTVHETAESVAENFVVKTREENGQTVGQLRDLIVIMDSSGSIGQTNFNKAKTQLARLLGLLCPDPDPFSQRQQVALIEFGSTVREVFDFNDNRNTQQVQDSIRRMTYMGGSTCSATAFNFANTNMFSTVKGMRTRTDVTQEILILSDGGSNCGGDAIAAAMDLNSKAEVYALVIGTPSASEQQELTSYVSTPSSDHLFSVLNYEDLETLVNDIQSYNLQCVPFDNN